MDITKVKAEFTIWGDKLIPEIITRDLDLKPTNAYVKGQMIEKPWLIGERKHKESFETKFSTWEIATDYEPSCDVNVQLKILYTFLENKVDILNQLKARYELDFHIVIVIKIEKGETPAIYFEKWLIDFAYSIGAIIDIDLYVNP
jgi:hypothetical protein